MLIFVSAIQRWIGRILQVWFVKIVDKINAACRLQSPAFLHLINIMGWDHSITSAFEMPLTVMLKWSWVNWWSLSEWSAVTYLWRIVSFNKTTFHYKFHRRFPICLCMWQNTNLIPDEEQKQRTIRRVVGPKVRNSAPHLRLYIPPRPNSSSSAPDSVFMSWETIVWK